MRRSCARQSYAQVVRFSGSRCYCQILNSLWRDAPCALLQFLATQPFSLQLKHSLRAKVTNGLAFDNYYKMICFLRSGIHQKLFHHVFKTSHRSILERLKTHFGIVTNCNKFSEVLFSVNYDIFASPLKLLSKVLKRWFIARSRNTFRSWIPYKVLSVY